MSERTIDMFNEQIETLKQENNKLKEALKIAYKHVQSIDYDNARMIEQLLK